MCPSLLGTEWLKQQSLFLAILEAGVSKVKVLVSSVSEDMNFGL